MSYLEKILPFTEHANKSTETQKLVKNTDMYTERSKEIKAFTKYFPQGVDKIIEEYDVMELKKGIYHSNAVKTQKISFGMNARSLNDDDGRICSIISLDDGTIVSISLLSPQDLTKFIHSNVEIRNSFGKIIKKIKLVAQSKVLVGNKKNIKIKMCQINHNLIGIVFVDVICNEVYILDVKDGEITTTEIIDIISTRNIKKISTDQIMIFSSNAIHLCKVNSNKTLETMTSENLTHLSTKVTDILMSESIRIEIIFNGYSCCHTIKSLDKSDDITKELTLGSNEILCKYYLINEFLFLFKRTFGGFSSCCVLNAKTLGMIKTLYESENCLHSDLIHLKDNLIAIIIVDVDLIYESKNRIFVHDMRSSEFILIQTISIGSVNCATNYINGLVTVDSSSCIRFYDYL